MHQTAFVQALRSTVLIAVAGAALALSPVTSAALVEATFSSVFDGGHRMQGTFTYDDSFATVTASGLGATDGLEELSVSFFAPSSSLLGSYDNVTNGISVYEFLHFTFDTVALSFSSQFDVGKDEGGTAQYYVDGFVGSLGTLTDVAAGGYDALDVANPWSIDVAIGAAPVPAPLALLATGLIGLRLSRR